MYVEFVKRQGDDLSRIRQALARAFDVSDAASLSEQTGGKQTGAIDIARNCTLRLHPGLHRRVHLAAALKEAAVQSQHGRESTIPRCATRNHSTASRATAPQLARPEYGPRQACHPGIRIASTKAAPRAGESPPPGFASASTS